MERIDTAQDQEVERMKAKKLEELERRRTLASSEAPQRSEGKPIILTDETFASEVSKHDVIVVDFWAAWCGPCRMVGPVIEQLASEYSGKVAFGKLNVDENPMVSNTFRIQSIPTMLIFKNGRPVDGLLGAVPKSHIEAKFRPYMAS